MADTALERIQTVADKDEAELLRAIGREVLARGLSAGETSPEEEEEEGRLYVHENTDRLRKAVCGSYVAQVIGGSGVSFDAYLAIAALADLIASVTVQVSPHTLAAYLLRVGIRRLCEPAG